MKRILRALVVVLGLALTALSAVTARAHDMEVDRLSLWIDPERGTLRGQLLFDPELTRRLDDPIDERARERALAFVREGLTIEADGEPIDLELSLRELWTRGGAVPGDSVMLTAALPRRAHALVVRVPARMKELLVVADLGAADSGASVVNALTTGGETAGPFALAHDEPATGSLGSYLWLGFRHVLPLGLDHVLFIVALALGSERRFRRLLLLSFAFTLAHSVTLGLGASGLLSIPGRIVEPLIALSIAVVALSNLWPRARRQEPWLAFVFGLLHGFGFAGVFGEMGFAAGDLVWPLLGFNLGVEVAQVVVLAACWLLLGAVDERRSYTHVIRPASVGIALCATFWVVERVFTF